MRVRLLLIAVALALLAVAGCRHDGTAPTGLRHGGSASGQLGRQPAPEPDATVIVSAATGSGTVQTQLLPGCLRHPRPAQRSSALGPHRPPVPHGTPALRFFPLLI